jgi:hypothetical protein
VNLTPRFGRIRFTGNAGDEIWLTGLTVRKKFNVGTETFVTSSDTIKETVGSDGTTKYIYATFTNSKKDIGLLTKDAAFTRSFSSDLLASSASGYIAIPTEESHNRWENGLVLTANGVSFKMIAVPGLSTSTHYCIAETETTAELYNKVTSTSTSSYYLTQYPECSVSISKASTFCTNLKSYTHLDFRLPTLSEWTYAASGGNKSKGYTYSGSNDINEVAWYSGNASTTHLVKQKLPNELGIYDMSGNVAEWTITEPTNPTTTYYSTLYCGGSYASGASLNTVSSASYFASSTTSSEYVGFRVVMPY